MKKQLFYFVALFLYVMGIIGGIGYSLYGGSWPIAIGIVVLAFMAFPTAKKMWNFLMA